MGITVPPDSTGKIVETNSPDGVTQRQVVTVGDKTTAANTASVLASGAVKIEPGGVNVQPISGSVTANVGTTNGLALDTTVSNVQVSTGTTAPAKIDIVGGKTSDGTPQYQPIPLTNAGAAVKTDATATTQPVSAASLPLPSGASTSAKQPALGTAGTASADVLTVQGIASMTPIKVDLASTGANATAIKTDSSATTQPVSGTVTANIGTSGSLALDATLTGGTARTKLTDGTNNAAVKAASTPAVATDPALVVAVSPNNSVTVTGSVTANIGTSGALALDATLTGGTTKTIVRGGAKGTTSAADMTSTASGANHQPLDVAIYDASGNQITSFGGGTQYADGATQATPTGTVALGKNGSNVVHALSLDGSGNLNVNLAAGTISGGNAAASATGAAVPASADYTGFNSGGNLVGVSSSNPLPITIANTGANATAIKVDGSAVTQPVSGTVTTTPPANASTNIAQVAGTTTDTNSGVKSAGTLRVVLATDQPTLTNKLLVTPDSVALPANQSVNVSQINAVTPLMGNGVTGTGSPRVTIASDNTAFTVNAAQSGTWTVQPGNTANTTAWLTQSVAGVTGGWTPSSQTAFTNTKVAVKASAGNFGGYMFYNPNASAVYIQVFDVASASVTLGTTAPTYVIPLPATAAANVEFSRGITHATAITVAATTTATGSTAPGTALTGFFLFK